MQVYKWQCSSYASNTMSHGSVECTFNACIFDVSVNLHTTYLRDKRYLGLCSDDDTDAVKTIAYVRNHLITCFNHLSPQTMGRWLAALSHTIW